MALRHATPRRSGLTLTELLVVISIIIIVSAVLTPMLRPVMRGRDVRESARQLNAYFEGARVRAARQGRPVGVWIERDPTNPRSAFQLRIAEQPVPYAGGTANARAVITGTRPSETGVVVGGARLSDTVPAFISKGDGIKFNYRGHTYEITSEPTPAGTGLTDIVFSKPGVAPPPVSAQGLPFQIFRQPRKTAAAPLDLPNGTEIVLAASGIGVELPHSSSPGIVPLTQWFGLGGNIAIMFRPDGRIDRVYNGGLPPKQPLSTIYLLVGRTGETAVVNLRDKDNIWVTIGARTGLVNTAPNAGTEIPPNAAPDMQKRAVIEAREMARTAQGMGGR